MSTSKKILLVEDEINFGSLMKNYLELSGYSVVWCKNGAEGYSTFMNHTFDLCILDIMMPHMDGFSLASKIRAKSSVPFFFLTARNAKADHVAGYAAGADDYLTKPFDTEILLLKINALLNRDEIRQPELECKDEYLFGLFRFTPRERVLKISDAGFSRLSPKESGLLELLCQYQNTVMPREVALKKIWKEDNYFTKRSMDVYIAKLRKRLAADPGIFIDTFHQTGFQLRVS